MQSKNGVRWQDTTIGRVREILKRFPESRDNDAYLTWLYLKKYEGLKLPFLEFRKFHELHLETLRRARQKIQPKGDFLPIDPEVQKIRGKERIKRSRKQGDFN